MGQLVATITNPESDEAALNSASHLLANLVLDTDNVAVLVRQNHTRSLIQTYFNASLPDTTLVNCCRIVSHIIRTSRRNGFMAVADSGARVPVVKDALDYGATTMASTAIGYNEEAWEPFPVSAERTAAGCGLLAALTVTAAEVRRVVLTDACVAQLTPLVAPARLRGCLLCLVLACFVCCVCAFHVMWGFVLLPPITHGCFCPLPSSRHSLGICSGDWVLTQAAQAHAESAEVCECYARCVECASKCSVVPVAGVLVVLATVLACCPPTLLLLYPPPSPSTHTHTDFSAACYKSFPPTNLPLVKRWVP